MPADPEVRLAGADAAIDRLAAIVEFSDDAIVSKTLDGIIQTWNRGAERLYGYEAHEIIGRPMALLLPPERHDEEPAILRRMQRGETVDHLESVRVRKDGSQIQVSLTISPVRDRSGNIIGISHIARDITERKRAEMLEERHRLALWAGGMGTWDWDIPAGRVAWSDTMAALLGFEPHAMETSYEWWLATLHPEDRARTAEQIGLAARDRTNFDTEFRVIWPDGSTHWLAARGQVLLSLNGHAARMGGVSWEITRLKQAELDRDAAAQRALCAEREVRGILESITDAFVAIDWNFCFTYVNAEAERVLRRNRRELLGTQIWAEFPELLGTAFETQCKRAIRERVIVEFETFYEPWRRWFEVKAYPAIDGGIAVYFRDITASKESAEALRISRERLDLVLSSIELGLWYCDLPFDKLIWNDRCKQHFFLPSDAEVTIQLFYERLHSDDRERTRRAIEHAIDTHSNYDVEYRTVSPEGRVRWVRAIGRGFYDELGRPVHFDGVTVDITDHKRSAEQMRETQKLESLGILAGGVAHDFNNLLTGILGNASLALESMSPGHPNRPLLEEVTRASERAADLTRQLLAYAGKGRFVVRRVDVSDVVREISVLIQASIPKNVELRLDLQRHLPSIEADTSQMQQIVMNLIINGAEAVNEGEPGTVQVSTGVQQVNHHLLASWGGSGELAPGKYVYLEVRDTGRGMDAETQARIFDPFFTTKFMGRGLGLAAVSGIVRAHKGVIRVSSSPGKGSTFKVLLPACTGALPLDQPPSRRDLSGKGLILVVDDEEVVRRTARNALQRYGYSVLLAENGQDAIDLFRQMHDRISLVLLDLTMPRMSGELALRHLQAIKPDVKVLLSSGYNEVETVRRFTGKGLAGFIQKPYNAVALAEKIKQVL